MNRFPFHHFYRTFFGGLFPWSQKLPDIHDETHVDRVRKKFHSSIWFDWFSSDTWAASARQSHWCLSLGYLALFSSVLFSFLFMFKQWKMNPFMFLSSAALILRGGLSIIYVRNWIWLANEIIFHLSFLSFSSSSTFWLNSLLRLLPLYIFSSLWF